VSDWYFVITSSADGIHIDRIDKQELLNRLGGDDPDDRYYGDVEPTIPKNFSFCDLEYGEDKMHIIKGDFVLPQPWEVE
jgi:hypothetical protein